METPEQRRERIEAAIWERLLTGPSCTETCWAHSRQTSKGCSCIVIIADAIIASDEAAGLVVVPVEPTDRMVEAGQEDIVLARDHGLIVYAAGVYVTMIAAAKEPT